MNMDLDLEEVAMTIVGNAGEARSLAYEALREAKTGNFDKAEELLKESREKSLVAHGMQTELICNEADGNGIAMNLLMVHAQDHLMNSILTRELVEELIDLYRRIGVEK